MNRYILILVCSVTMVTHFSFADTPILDVTTVTMPKAKVLNKCIDANNKVTYTQFECKGDTAKVEENWQDQANLTYSTSRERSFSQRDDILSAITGGNRGPFDQENLDDQKGIDMLKDAMKDKSLLELFDNGVKALMLRQQILNSI